MNTAVFAILSAFLFLCDYVLSHPVKYDQRQEGDLNVRTDVEDVVFVVVPPQDLVAAGMGLVAATAADFLRKNYGSVGPERWPLRTSPKLGFVPLEKSPYKIDLEKSGIKVKKVSQVGDPNRYNFHDYKNPSKTAPETKVTTSTEIPEKSTVETIAETIDEMPSTTECKTVKKVLKPEEIKKTSTVEDKTLLDNKKEEKPNFETKKKTEALKSKVDEKTSAEPPKVIGEGTKDGLDPTSLLRLEGCGPDGQRDSTGKCVYQKSETSST